MSATMELIKVAVPAGPAPLGILRQREERLRAKVTEQLAVLQGWDWCEYEIRDLVDQLVTDGVESLQTVDCLDYAEEIQTQIDRGDVSGSVLADYQKLSDLLMDYGRAWQVLRAAELRAMGK